MFVDLVAEFDENWSEWNAWMSTPALKGKNWYIGLLMYYVRFLYLIDLIDEAANDNTNLEIDHDNLEQLRDWMCDEIGGIKEIL